MCSLPYKFVLLTGCCTQQKKDMKKECGDTHDSCGAECTKKVDDLLTCIQTCNPPEEGEKVSEKVVKSDKVR